MELRTVNPKTTLIVLILHNRQEIQMEKVWGGGLRIRVPSKSIGRSNGVVKDLICVEKEKTILADPGFPRGGHQS